MRPQSKSAKKIGIFKKWGWDEKTKNIDVDFLGIGKTQSYSLRGAIISGF